MGMAQGAMLRQNGVEIASDSVEETDSDGARAASSAEGSVEETTGLIPKPLEQRSLSSRAQSLLLKYFLPIGFAMAMLISIVWPLPGKFFADLKVSGVGVMQTLCVCIMFLISGLCFNTSDIKGAIQAFQGLIFGVVSVLFLTPLSGLAIMELSFIPHHFRVGLCVFACVPTTLTIGVALLEQAGGNAALGLLLTIITNIFGTLTVPFAVRWTVGSSSNASIDAEDLLVKLLLTILVPLAIGKALLDLSPRIRAAAAAQKTALSVIKNSACVAIVWFSMSHSRKDLMKQKAYNIALLLVFGALLHVAFLFFNFLCCWLIKLRQRELLAVVIMSSQKTFAVSLALISYLDPNNVGDLGLLSIPCILAHMTQLFIDSFLLSKWNYSPIEDTLSL